MSERQTPETDAAIVPFWDESDPRQKGPLVAADFARGLERQRDELLEALDSWLKVEDDSEDYFVSTGLKREPDHPVVAKARAAIASVKGGTK